MPMPRRSASPPALPLLLLLLLLAAMPVRAAPDDGWYVTIGGGVSDGAEPRVDYIGIPIDIDRVEQDAGWSLSTAVGRRRGALRAEVELQHLQGTERRFIIERVEVAPGLIRTDARNRVTALTANLSYDFLRHSAIQPFVMAGAGIGLTDAETAVLDITTATPMPGRREEDETVLAAQLGVGLNWPVTDTITIRPSYRYFWAKADDSLEFRTLRLGIQIRF